MKPNFTLPKRVKRLAAASVLCSSFIVASVASQNALPVHASGGGPVVLDGMDPVCHTGGGTENYIANVLKGVYDASSFPSNDGHIAVVGSGGGNCSGSFTSGGSMDTDYLSLFSSAPSYDLYDDAAVDTFFTDLAAGTVKPKMIWIPDNWSRNDAVETALTSHASDIADFVNAGGGLFSNYGGYGWLTALFSSARLISDGSSCNGGPYATTLGSSAFGLTDSMVGACWHGYFAGSFTLGVLADQAVGTGSDPASGSDDIEEDCDKPYSGDCATFPLVPVSIGGASVTLPSALSGSVDNSKPDAGTTVTVTVSTVAPGGVINAGVTVTITVTSGPNAGYSTTVTTDENGLATFTLKSDIGGTDEISLSATVNGKDVTSSVTIEWQGPEPKPDADGNLPELKKGETFVYLDGEPVVVTTKIVAGTTLEVSATDGFKLSLAGECSLDCTIKTNADGKPYMELESGGKAKISGEGFEAGTYANVFLFSTPVFLGKLLVGADGTFSGSLPVPDIGPGEHTLQVWGTSASGGIRTANLGVVILGQPSVGINALPWIITMMLFLGLGTVVFALGKRRALA